MALKPRYIYRSGIGFYFPFVFLMAREVERLIMVGPYPTLDAAIRARK